MCVVFPWNVRSFPFLAPKFSAPPEFLREESRGQTDDRCGLATNTPQPRGMLRATRDSMANRPKHITLAARGGTSGTFSYALSEGRGWDVRAEVDHRLVMQRHCSTWRSVEHCYDLLGRDLGLVDVHANLVVDIFGEALP